MISWKTRNADIFSWEHLPLITLTPPSWPTFLRLHVKSIHRSQCKKPKHSKIHSQYVSSLLRPFPKFFPRCCWNLKISHLTLSFQVEPTFHNFSTLVTPMAGQTPVVCFQSQPRVPPMHKNPFSGFPGQLSADGWIGRQVNLDRCVFTRGDSQVITSRIPSLYCRKQTSLRAKLWFSSCTDALSEKREIGDRLETFYKHSGRRRGHLEERTSLQYKLLGARPPAR